MTSKTKIMGAKIPDDLYENIQSKMADKEMSNTEAVIRGLRILDALWGAS